MKKNFIKEYGNQSQGNKMSRISIYGFHQKTNIENKNPNNIKEKEEENNKCYNIISCYIFLL